MKFGMAHGRVPCFYSSGKVEMKTIIPFLIILLLFVSGAQAGGYFYQKLEDMIAEVDTIVLAKVMSVTPPHLEVDVVETLAGNIPAQQLKLTYVLPAIWDEDGTTYWFDIPGSGLEVRLEVGKDYVLLLKEEEHDTQFELIRAEPPTKREVVIDVWKKSRNKPAIQQD
jgi:hypothetical protein